MLMSDLFCFWQSGVFRGGRLGLCRWGLRFVRRTVGGDFERPFLIDRMRGRR